MANDGISRQFAKYYKSFSGADALAFLLFPQANPVCLGSLTTISYSVFREKQPVRLMNRVSVPAFTKGLRYCAGTMVFTMINKQWTHEVMDQISWLKTYGKIKADELPPFDVMIICANEYGASTSMHLYAVEITDEAQTLSIEDIFTENQFSFLAKDIDTFDSDETGKISLSNGSTSFRQSVESALALDMTVLTKGELVNQIQGTIKKSDELTIWVNSVKVEIPVSEKERPRIFNGSTIAPMTFVFNAMGWKSSWVTTGGVSKAVYSSKGTGSENAPQYKLEITHNTQQCYFYVLKTDGSYTKTSVPFARPPFVSNGRTVCEIRPLFDFLSKKIEAYTTTWGEDSGNVWIDSQVVKNKPLLNSNTNDPSYVDEIQDMQARLNAKGIVPKLKLTGVMDFPTIHNLTLLQSRSKLPTTGVADTATWAALLKEGILTPGEWPRSGTVINPGGAQLRKAQDNSESSVVTRIATGQTVQVTGPAANGWGFVTASKQGITLKGYMDSRDIRI